MDGGLSQDEINALLAGMDLSDEEPEAAESKNMAGVDSEGGYNIVADENETLTDEEKDAIGEIGNINMGSSATTLYSLVNMKVNITTPVVEIADWETLLDQYERPCVFIQIKYTVGLDGTNILILKEQDVKVIADLMMGGDGTNTDGELGELHLSAISEAMNQMMGASATSLSTMMGTKIDISPPEASLLDLTQVADGGDVSPFLGGRFVKIAFRMQIGDLVDSSIMQIYPFEFAHKVVDTFMNSQNSGGNATQKAIDAMPEISGGANGQAANPQMAGGMPGNAGMPMGGMPGMGAGMPMGGMPGMGGAADGGASQMAGGMPGYAGMPMGMNPQMGYPQMGYPQMVGGMPMGAPSPQMMGGMSMGPMGMQNINVQPAQFQSFSGDGRSIAGQENIGLIMDVPLNVTVELGRTTKSISEILDFAPGTIIELDRIAGEPIDVLVNGKLVAKGEVVVIEESFAVRVTEIIK